MTTDSKFHSGLSAERIAFSSLLSGAYASAAVALLFLVIDGLRGDPLFTPSLLGTVFLLGQSPLTHSAARLDMVALYSVVHFLAFATLGTMATFLYASAPSIRNRPALLSVALFSFLSAGALVVDVVFAPGLVASIGLAQLLSANAMSAAAMGSFIHLSIRDAFQVPVQQSARPRLS